MTQVAFCPFCGLQAMNDTLPKKRVEIVQKDLAIADGEHKNREWRFYHKPWPVMNHFQFGTVRVLGSDGVHSRVMTANEVQVTVCVENLEEIKGERVLAKVGGDKERKQKVKETELLAKYLKF